MCQRSVIKKDATVLNINTEVIDTDSKVGVDLPRVNAAWEQLNAIVCTKSGPDSDHVSDRVKQCVILCLDET